MVNSVVSCISENLENTTTIKREVIPHTLSDRGERDLRKNIFSIGDDSEISGKTIRYVDTETNEKLGYMNISYTDNIAYLGFIQVPKYLQNCGVATTMIRDDLIPFCEELDVSELYSVSKAEEMRTVFGEKLGFEETDSEGTYYLPIE